MNELDERECRERVAIARTEERANSITRIVIVTLFVAGAITHRRLFGLFLVLGLVIHLMRMNMDNQRTRFVFTCLETIFVIVGVFAIMTTFMS